MRRQVRDPENRLGDIVRPDRGGAFVKILRRMEEDAYWVSPVE
jgi:hypothetical protein